MHLSGIFTFSFHHQAPKTSAEHTSCVFYLAHLPSPTMTHQNTLFGPKVCIFSYNFLCLSMVFLIFVASFCLQHFCSLGQIVGCYDSLFHLHILLLLSSLFDPPCLIPVQTAPCLLHMLLIYFIQGCAPHPIIMLNHDDSILFPILSGSPLCIMYKYSRDSYLYFNSLLRNIPHILFALKPYQLANNCTKAQIRKLDC